MHNSVLKGRDTLIEKSETLIEQSLNIIYSNKAVTLKCNTLIQQPAKEFKTI